jgi:hypothetical protein
VCYNPAEVMKKLILFASLIIFLSSNIFAFVPQPTPSLNGTTGLIMMPSADVIPYKNVDLGMDIGNNNINNKFSLLYKMSIGTFQGMELGAVGSDDGLGNIREGVFINMKYSLATDTSPYPLLFAIGCENLTSANKADIYMVATRYIPSGSRFHFGFLGDFPGNKFRPMGALGFDTPTFLDRLYFITDMFAGESVFQLDMGLRYYASESIAINFSGVNITADQNTPTDNYKDPKMILIGVSWINPL